MRLRQTLLVAALAALGCGPLPEDGAANAFASDAEPIINGHACGPVEEPATVAILIDTTLDIPGYGSQKLKSVICTGTLVAPDVVVAAAHCVDPKVIGEGIATLRNTKYYISFTADLTALAERRVTSFPLDAVEVRKWVEHPQFLLPGQSVSGPGNFHDASILFLSKVVSPRPEVVITAAETAQIATGKAVQIAGWGQSTQTGQSQPPPPGTVGRKICADSHLGVIGQFELQVGGDATTSRKCHGDSGGPTFLTVDTATTNKRRLIGITSHAFDDSDCARGGVDTRVDVMRDWLDAELKKGCADHTRAWCDFDGVVTPEFWEGPVKTDPGSAGDAPKPKGCSRCDTTDLASSLALLALFVRRRR